MKVYVIQGKSGIMMNIGASVKNQMSGFLAKMTTCGILVHIFVSAIRHVKLMDIQTLKTVHVKNF